MLRERQVVFVLGPTGVGKTSVALRLVGPEPLYLNTRGVQDALVERVARRCWGLELRHAPSLVLDGPVWLRTRPAAADALCELLEARSEAGLRTAICQDDQDGSLDVLLGCMPAGSVVVVGLRFPMGKRGRMRFARRICDELGIPRTLARGTEEIEPWGYAAVIEHLHARKLAAAAG